MNSLKNVALWEEKEYDYPLAFGFTPNLMCYLHEDSAETKPCILVVPGGVAQVGNDMAAQFVGGGGP